MAPAVNEIPRRPTIDDDGKAQDSPAAPRLELKPEIFSEILSQHTSCLTSHLDFVNKVRDVVVPGSETYRKISAMLDRTRELIAQFETIKELFLPHGPADHIFSPSDANNPHAYPGTNIKPMRSSREPPRSSAAAPSERLKPKNRGAKQRLPLGSRSTSESQYYILKMGQKRPRDDVTTMPEVDNAIVDATQKRKRTRDTIPGSNEDVQSAIPVSMQTEDISDEVERRLKLREERRRKRNSRPEKRSRDSLDSSDVILSSENPRKPKKQKLRAENARQS